MAKGLEILIPKRKSEKKLEGKKEPIFWIEIKKIKPNPLQPRQSFNQKELKELADSIEKYGILQPLIAKKIIKENKSGQKVEYQLIAGERRLRAAKIAGLKEVPVMVQEIEKEDELPISLVENIQREDLNPIEKALAYKELIEKHNLTQKEVGEIVGKSRETVANTLRLLDLPEKIKLSLIKREISEGHARALLGVPKNQIMDFFKEIIEKKISVRKAEKLSEKKKNKKITLIERPQDFKKLEKEISEKLGVEDVKITQKEKKIELKIFFNSKKELKDFLKIINFIK
jgi:ParB family chromosome partitioning protein